MVKVIVTSASSTLSSCLYLSLLFPFSLFSSSLNFNADPILVYSFEILFCFIGRPCQIVPWIIRYKNAFSSQLEWFELYMCLHLWTLWFSFFQRIWVTSTFNWTLIFGKCSKLGKDSNLCSNKICIHLMLDCNSNIVTSKRWSEW